MIQEVKGDIWDYHDEGYIVITTNVGWKTDGSNPMGAGLASQAAERFPDLPKLYGAWCKLHGGMLLPLPSLRLIMFPTKPINSRQPWLSWRNAASLPLIRKSMQQLVCLMAWCGIDKVYMPRVGCGHGGLDWNNVHLVLSGVKVTSGEVIVVDRESEEESASN